MPKHSRRMIGGSVLAAIALPLTAAGQPEPPRPTRQQREALQALIAAVDKDPAAPDSDNADWPLHVLRASDGSHYVAFSINRVEGIQPDRPFVLYVRLSTRRQNPAGPTERSTVAEWLAGQSPAPPVTQRGLAFGEMPTYGAGGIATRGPGAGTQNLQLLELERQRAREKQEEQERARKASLEGAEAVSTPRPLLPFEDFDFRAQTVKDSTGAAVIRRSLTAGPGSYLLSVAWVHVGGGDAAGGARVVRRELSLPPASTTAFALSSVIVADDVSVRETPVPPSEQTARPYSIGGTEISPARDHALTPDERLALVVQVINPRSTPSGKPDVAVGFRVLRRTATREEAVGTLAPQIYNEVTLPPDFEVAKGHPIFAAVAVPLRTFKRGNYRLEIAANDRVAGTGVVTDVEFTVTGTPRSLLAEAPPLAAPFQPTAESLPAQVEVMLGAARATEGKDRDAIAAWERAIAAGADPAGILPLIIDAWLRQGDTARAADLARQGLTARPGDGRLTRQLATALMVAGRFDDALPLLEARLVTAADDTSAQWLAIHLLFTQWVSGQGAGSTSAGRSRLVDLASRYAGSNGPHAALARDWATAAR